MDILTEQKKSFFDTFGFLAFPGLLADCIDEIIEAFEAIWAPTGRWTQRTTARRHPQIVHRAIYRPARTPVRPLR